MFFKKLVGPAAAVLMMSPAAMALTITGGFSGSWYDPASAGQGFNLEVIGGPGGSQVVAYWYGFDADGGPTWAFGVGDVEGDSVSLRLIRPLGVAKGAGFEDIAEVTLSFDDCENGDATFGDGNEQVGTGFMELSRITDVEGVECTGGISDNFEDSDGEIEIRVDLMDTGVFPGAEGHADFEERADRTEFSVEIEDLPDGIYDLFVAGEFRGSLEVVGGLEAEIEFRSPVEDGKLLLDFDPRGQTIDVEFGGMVVLTADMPTEPAPEDGDDDDSDDGGVVDTGGLGEYEVELASTGASDAGEGEAKLEIREDRTEFEVEIEDLPPGIYELLVAGTPRGELEIVDGEEVEIEFRDPSEDGKLPLEFDPRGELIEIVMGDVVYLFADFPLTPTDAIDDDDGIDDDGGDDDDDDEDEDEDEDEDDDDAEDDDV